MAFIFSRYYVDLSQTNFFSSKLNHSDSSDRSQTHKHDNTNPLWWWGNYDMHAMPFKDACVYLFLSITLRIMLANSVPVSTTSLCECCATCCGNSNLSYEEGCVTKFANNMSW